MIRNIFFDLDGTMLPMNQEQFVKVYFTELAKRFCPKLKTESEKLIKAVWKSTESMVKNDGKEPNINAFWKTFSKLLGKEVLKYTKDFDDFYNREFSECKSVCKYNPNVPEIMRVLKNKGYRLIAATNPLFPAVAINNRIKWAGLDQKAFDLITTYENFTTCKPNPRYFTEIMEKINAKPDECLMVGNDVDEDILASEKAGIKSYLITDCLINRGEADISRFENGGMRDFLIYARMLPDVKQEL